MKTNSMGAKRTWTGAHATCPQGEQSESNTAPKLYIGLDVRKEQTSVAIADPGAGGEVRSYGNISTSQPFIVNVLRKLTKARGLQLTDLHVCYEAGGCGMWIARQLAKIKVRCTVVAPFLIPSKAGDQVKTDKKDAIKLARLLRAGELTSAGCWLNAPPITASRPKSPAPLPSAKKASRNGSPRFLGKPKTASAPVSKNSNNASCITTKSKFPSPANSPQSSGKLVSKYKAQRSQPANETR